VEGRFCRGFCENVRSGRGVFVVNLWWIGALTWCFDGHYFASKNMPTFQNIFDLFFQNIFDLF
jgi:hypothetical protein